MIYSDKASMNLSELFDFVRYGFLVLGVFQRLL